MNESLETRVIERVNSFYLIPRKSSELLDAYGRVPLTITDEVIGIAEQFLRNRGVDTTQKDEVTGWDIFWAREMATAMAAIPNTGRTYQNFLPGRFLHYDILAHNIAALFNFNGGESSSIMGKSVAEIGSGSGLGLVKLAERGANVTAFDSSIMGLDFTNYLAGHYNVRNRVTLVKGNYFDMPQEIASRQFDVVYNSGVLEHERDAKGLIAQMAGITKPGGYVVITVPNEESKFYRRFKDTEEGTRRRFPLLPRIPVENRRYHHNISHLMAESNLLPLRQDGLQVAVSTRIDKGDINQSDLLYFEGNLPQPLPPFTPPDIPHKVNAWSILELYATREFRLRYGWSTYYVGQKPQLQPSGN